MGKLTTVLLKGTFRHSTISSKHNGAGYIVVSKEILKHFTFSNQHNVAVDAVILKETPRHCIINSQHNMTVYSCIKKLLGISPLIANIILGRWNSCVKRTFMPLTISCQNNWAVNDWCNCVKNTFRHFTIRSQHNEVMYCKTSFVPCYKRAGAIRLFSLIPYKCM